MVHPNGSAELNIAPSLLYLKYLGAPNYDIPVHIPYYSKH
jgi:hypothetical protein